MLKSFALSVIVLVAASVRVPAGFGATTLLVFPPENLTKRQDLAWISEALAISISEQIKIPGADCIEREDRLGLIEAADLPPNAPLSNASMIRLAQQAAADYLIIGQYLGKPDNIKVILKIFNLKSLKLGGDISATGPISALPQMENELAWIILSELGLDKNHSRQKHVERTRPIPNQAYSLYVRAISQPIASDESIQLLEKAVSLYSDIPDAQYLIGSRCYSTGDFAHAITHLEFARKRQIHFLDCLFMMGTSYLRLNLLDDSIHAYEAIVSFGQYPEVYNNLGVAYLRKKDLALAAQNLVGAHSLARSDGSVIFNLALLRYLEGNFAAAASVLDGFIKSYPRDRTGKYLSSLVFRSMGDAGKAEEALASSKKDSSEEFKDLEMEPLHLARIHTIWQRRR